MDQFLLNILRMTYQKDFIIDRMIGLLGYKVPIDLYTTGFKDQGHGGPSWQICLFSLSYKITIQRDSIFNKMIRLLW